MKEVSKNLFVGNDLDCANSSGFAVIHACKTCHQKALRYTGSLTSSNPNYLFFQKDKNLFLNMVDMRKVLEQKFTNPIMESAILFINENVEKRRVLIHCNQGFSRSPSIALIYLSLINILPNTFYLDAKNDFTKVFPEYNPGSGIELYMMNNWKFLMELPCKN